MHRWTARLLMLLVLVGILAPIGMAMTPPPPHACCLRKARQCHGSSPQPAAHHHNHSGPGISAADCCQRDICRPLISSQWAVTKLRSFPVPASASTLQRSARILVTLDHVDSLTRVRAPPIV